MIRIRTSKHACSDSFRTAGIAWMLVTAEWELARYDFENHHEGRTNPRLVPKSDEAEKARGKITHPRRHMVREDG